jgi:hypothetical protein
VRGGPPGGIDEDADTVEHDANGDRVVRRAGAGECAVEMRVEEQRMRFACGSTV